MAEDFTNLVLKLAQDPATLREFREQPTSVMEYANLSPAEQTILLSGDASLIRRALIADNSAEIAKAELSGGIWPITVVVAITVVVTHAVEEEVLPE